MRKIVFRIAIFVGAFVVGSGIFAIAVFNIRSVSEADVPKVPEINSMLVKQKDEYLESKTFPGLSHKISKLEKGKSGYFPAKIWMRYPEQDDFFNDWYGKHLKAMDEKSLLDVSDANVESYRFLWLRSFHHPIFVRVERNQSEAKLFTKELNGAGGYEPGKVLRANEIVLKQEDFYHFLNLVEESNYWNLPTHDDGLSGHDGAQWVLEAVKDGRYHMVDRWSPQNGEYREACIYLLKLSGVDVDRLKHDLY